jgi:O-antigen ligase
MAAAMAARIELPDWVSVSALLGLCGAVGLLAGVDARLAIIAALGLGVILVMLADLTTGLLLFTGIVFLESLLPAGQLLTFTKVAGLLLVLSWLAKVGTEGDRASVLPLAHPGFAFMLVGFLGWAAISVLWAKDVPEAWTDLSRYLLAFTLLVIVFTAVRRREDALRVLAVFIAGCAVTAAYALIVRPGEPEADVLRVSSTVGNANVVASILVAGLVLSVAAFRAGRGAPLIRLAAVATAVLSVAALFETGSRSGAIALGAALVVGVMVAGRWRLPTFLGAVALALVIVTTFVAFAPAEIRERIGLLTPGELPAIEGRTTIWQVGVRMVEDQPLQGVGVGNFQAASSQYAVEPGLSARSELVIDDPQVAHNVYLQVLAELGIVGLALFGGVLAFSLRCALAAARRFERDGDEAMEIFARALIPALVAVLVSDVFASEQFNKLLWLLLGLGPSLLAISHAAGRRRSP